MKIACILAEFKKSAVENLTQKMLSFSSELLAAYLQVYYSQIHPALQQIPAHSTPELCLWWLTLDRDITSHVGAS